MLIYLLIFEQWTAGSAIFYSILCLMLIMILQKLDFRNGITFIRVANQILDGCQDIIRGMIKGSMNMTNVAIAIGAAGIIVGSGT